MESVKGLINAYGGLYDATEAQKAIALRVVHCENPEMLPTLQSRIVKRGVREPSFGLAQIHLPSNPDISKEQATDPGFAISFLMKNIVAHKGTKWSCWAKV